ncbi:SEL1-like repeat protein [Sideroxyarcus sp. TK5]
MKNRTLRPLLFLLLSAWAASAQADWRSQFDADRFSSRMNELLRAEQRSTDGIIAGAQADMARQTAGYYERRARERDARFAAFQRAMADAEAAERAERQAARAAAASAASRPREPSGYEILQRMEAAARNGDATVARTLGDAYRAGVGAAQQNAATAAQWYELAARGGDVLAASALGAMYANGIGVARDDAAAFRYTLQAAQGGEETALGNAGTMYEFGLGTTKNDAEAVRWYKLAADKGSARGQSGYGRALLLGRGGLAADARAAMEYLRPAAMAGDSAAQMFAAQTLMTGNGVPRDTAQALQWYESAARDFPQLYGDLASLHVNGAQYGIAQDREKAIEYAKRGAEAGDGMAMYLLADAYFNGRTIAKDDVAGRQWIAKSAAAGYAPGMYSYSLCLSQGVGGAVDHAEAERWLLRAADAGVVKAQFDASILLFSSSPNTAKDIPRAVRMMRAAAEGGHADAQANYANFLEVGELVPADPVAAREWARRSADQGNVVGLINYGDLLLRGVGGPRDQAGARLLEKASAMDSQFSPHAALTLGQYYRDGQYLPRDVALARQWLEKACALGHPEAEKELQTLR